MPSLTDLANQVNNTLTEIQTNTAAINTRLDTVITGINQLNTTTVAGFYNLSTGLYALLETQREANAHLATQISQSTAIICLLTTTNDLLCQSLRVAERQLAVAEQTQADVAFLRSVDTLVHAREGVEVTQRAELQARLDACCAEPTPPDAPCYTPCATPTVVTHKPAGQDWKPQSRPGR